MNDDNNLLDELLNVPDTNTESVQWERENEALRPLLREIESIEDQRIREFVRAVLYRATTFWTVPASFTGEFHPPDEHGEGGNVVHTRRVVRVAALLSTAQELTTLERDCCLAAALLHDLTKGMEWQGDVTYDPMHPYTVDAFVADVQAQEVAHYEQHSDRLEGSSSVMIGDDHVATILRLVRCHHGPWSPIPETYPLTRLEWTLHLANVIASHLHSIVDDAEEVRYERWLLP